MATEIERKYLLKTDEWRREARGEVFRQGYLSRAKGRTVRVRVAGEQAWITIKGPSEGFSRAEFEYEVPRADALEMLGLCEGLVIEKTRYRVPFGGFVWEVDEFSGANEGLVVAEIELPSESTVFPLPPWAGIEVTDDPRYANSQLSENPYSQWGRP